VHHRADRFIGIVRSRIESLAQYYTSKIKYDPDGFAEASAAVEALLRERGFLV